MLIHGLAVESSRYLALSFVAPASWEWSQQHRATKQRTWPWVLPLVAMGLAQIAMGILHPDIITQAYYSLM